MGNAECGMRNGAWGMTTPAPAGGRRKPVPTPAGQSRGQATPFAFLGAIPDWAILLLFFGLILVQAIPSLQQESATFDELVRQLPGYLHLTAKEYRIHSDHPPFIKMLAALPLLFMEVKIPSLPESWTDLTRWNWHHDFLYVANDADRLVLFGRLAVLSLTLLLGYFVFRWSRELFGRAAACFALFLYSFEPNILAHGRLMNTDLAMAGFFFVTCYCFSRLARGVTLLRVLSTGITLGLALTTKYTAVMAFPILLLLALGLAFSRVPLDVRVAGWSPAVLRGRAHKLLVLVGALIMIGVVAYGMIWAIHGFRYAAGTGARYAFANPWERVLPEGPMARAAVLWARESRFLPEAYLHGLALGVGKGTRLAFLMGETRIGGWWYYFVISVLLKTPLALLLLLVIAGARGRVCWRGRGLEAFFLLVPPLAYFTASCAGSLNIGHRHILPIYPFLFVLAGSLIPWMRRQKAVVTAGVAALGVWYIVSSASIFPHYLAYFNELVGGPNQGYKYLVDSNLDWGQDLKGLKRYMDAHGIRRVWLSYFGTASPDYYGIRYNYLPSYIIFDPKDEIAPTPFVAISATNLQGAYAEHIGVDPDFFKEFRTREPIAKIGYSIFLYRLK